MKILQDKKKLIEKMSILIYIQSYLLALMILCTIALIGLVMTMLPLKEVRPWLLTSHNSKNIIIKELDKNDVGIEKELVSKFVISAEEIDSDNVEKQTYIIHELATKKLASLIIENITTVKLSNELAKNILRKVKIISVKKSKNIYEVEWKGIDTDIENNIDEHVNISRIRLTRGTKVCQNPLNICISSYQVKRISY